MSRWFERWRRRQRDIAQGADADLFRDNGKRYRLAVGLIGLGFLISLLDAKILIPGALRTIIVAIAILSIIAGFLLALWSRQERAFLNKSDPGGQWITISLGADYLFFETFFAETSIVQSGQRIENGQTIQFVGAYALLDRHHQLFGKTIYLPA